MYFTFRSPLKLSAISQTPFNVAQRRQHYEIAVIDNDPFAHTKELQSHGYRVRELGDIHDFAAVAEYPIVACDIRDVGLHFGDSHQGAHVLGEIRLRYPGKFLIAYSGGVFGTTYKKYWDHCDVCLRRDGGFDQWVETLDKGIATLGDPVQHWRRIRKTLVESDISAFEVYLLEQAYIKSILKKNPYHLEKEMKRIQTFSVAGELTDSIAAGLVTSVKLLIHICS